MVRAAHQSAADPDQTPESQGLLLASRSPRRRKLLVEAGIPHDAADPGVDDGPLSAGGVYPAQWAAALAYLKAAAGRDRTGHAGPVLGADTVCVLDGSILGQPRDISEARWMLESFRGRSHEVITGAAVIGLDGSRTVLADSATVRFGLLGAGELEAYLAGSGWDGKAGGYNLEDRIAAGWPIEFDGDPGTIMGLPMRRLAPLLERLGIRGGNRVAQGAGA